MTAPDPVKIAAVLVDDAAWLCGDSVGDSVGVADGVDVLVCSPRISGENFGDGDGNFVLTGVGLAGLEVLDWEGDGEAAGGGVGLGVGIGLAGGILIATVTALLLASSEP